MGVWRSFIDLVHLIGALGCLALLGGFAAQGEAARAVFYGLCTMGFALALARRVHEHQTPAPRPTVTAATVIDLREPATTDAARPR